MKIAYFDCFAGASGNMILGALVDAGLPIASLERELRKLPVSGWNIRAQRVSKRGLSALYLDVDVPGEDVPRDHAGHFADHHHEGMAHRKLGDILAILDAANFSDKVRQTASVIYRRLAEAEGKIHGASGEEIAFHEVGQVDAIVDIAGASVALDLLGIDAVYSSAMPCGKGRITSAHGVGPSPAPATLELLRGKPTYALDVEGEFVTPTGAAILSTVAAFESRPAMTINSIGYGAGRSDFPFPNVLRVIIGESADVQVLQGGVNDIVQLETNIDDMNPQLYEYVFERLFASGALDVWTQSVVMKKGRPGIVLGALAPLERADAVAASILAETTSIGVRSWRTQRVILPRRVETLTTSMGPVRVKIVDGLGAARARPEYEDVRNIAATTGKPLAHVMASIEREVAALLDGR